MKLKIVKKMIVAGAKLGAGTFSQAHHREVYSVSASILQTKYTACVVNRTSSSINGFYEFCLKARFFIKCTAKKSAIVDQ